MKKVLVFTVAILCFLTSAFAGNGIDLSPYGINLVIEAPEGATATKSEMHDAEEGYLNYEICQGHFCLDIIQYMNTDDYDAVSDMVEENAEMLLDGDEILEKFDGGYITYDKDLEYYDFYYVVQKGDDFIEFTTAIGDEDLSLADIKKMIAAIQAAK